MPITLLRWKGGSGGDTLLKCLLDSNPDWQSQATYGGLDSSRTPMSSADLPWSGYEQIRMMATIEYIKVDTKLLAEQLIALEARNSDLHWLLKTHCYQSFEWRTIDIVISRPLLPFVVKANLSKNSRERGLVPDYHEMTGIIRDPSVLYRFDCYNMAKDCLDVVPADPHQTIYLDDIMQGWDRLKWSCDALCLPLRDHCRPYFEAWLEANQSFLPSLAYQQMVKQDRYDATCPDLSLEERYCVLAIEGERFRLL